jgi:hypothetical protein
LWSFSWLKGHHLHFNMHIYTDWGDIVAECYLSMMMRTTFQSNQYLHA